MTSHPPDEYTQQASMLVDSLGPWWRSDMAPPLDAIANVLRDLAWNAYRRGAEEMREQAAEAGFRACACSNRQTVCNAIRALALPTGPAAPEGEHAVGDLWESPGGHRYEVTAVNTVPRIQLAGYGALWPSTETNNLGWRRVRRGGGA